MRDSEGCFAALAIIAVLLVIVIGGPMYGSMAERRYWQAELVERGVCEWYADPKTGVRELKWKCGEVRHEQAD